MSGRFTVETMFKANDQMSSVIGKMEKKLGSFIDRTSGGLKKLDAFNARVSSGIKATAGAATAVGAAAGVVAANSIQAGMAFEQQIADLGASFMKTRDEIGPLEKEALRLGAATKFSAVEIAGAMEEMSKAGFTEEQTLKGVAGMSFAAAAAGEELIETTANVSAVMKGMQIDVSKSAEVADVLALASVKTASSIGSLAESLAKAGPVAKQFNIPLNDTVAMTALLQDAGIDASEAGSAVATMLTRLATPSKTAKAQMKALGISFTDAAGNMKSPSKMLEQFAKASKNSGGNMKQAAFFAEMLGLRGQKAGLLLQEAFKNGKYGQLVDDLKNAEGTAQKMADLRMNSLTGDLDVFMENVKGLQVELFSLNSGPLRELVKGATAWVDKNKDGIIQKIQEGVTWLVDHLPQIVIWIERIGKSLVVFYAFSFAVKTVQFAVEAYEAAVLVAKGTQWLFTKSIQGTRAAVEAFQALNAAAHMSKTGQAIEGVQSKLGKFGMLASVAAVGYAFGSWLNETFALDQKISGWLAGLTGIEDKLNKMGGRADKQGLVPGGDQYLADGSIRRADGSWIKKTEARIAKEAAVASRGLSSVPTASAFEPQLITPHERAALSFSETTETTKVEVVIKDESGNATVTKPPKAKNFSIKLQPSGAF